METGSGNLHATAKPLSCCDIGSIHERVRKQAQSLLTQQDKFHVHRPSGHSILKFWREIRSESIILLKKLSDNADNHLHKQLVQLLANLQRALHSADLSQWHFGHLPMKLIEWRLETLQSRWSNMAILGRDGTTILEFLEKLRLNLQIAEAHHEAAIGAGQGYGDEQIEAARYLDNYKIFSQKKMLDLTHEIEKRSCALLEVARQTRQLELEWSDLMQQLPTSQRFQLDRSILEPIPVEKLLSSEYETS